MFSKGHLRIRKRKKAIQRINELLNTPENTLLVHYSCESFFDNTKGSNRTTSIAVRYLESGQAHSFSIHQIAEELGLSMNRIPDHYDEIEKKLLDKYFQFVREHQSFKWVHWNMRDINYGFLALEHRGKLLECNLFQIANEKKFDLSRILIDLYGPSYIKHPRFTKLIEKNFMTNRDFLSGSEEADAFKSGEYAKLHRSTLRKCDLMESILESASGDSLLVDSGFFQKYGISPELLGYLVREHWFFSLVTFLFAVFGCITAIHDIFQWITRAT